MPASSALLGEAGGPDPGGLQWRRRDDAGLLALIDGYARRGGLASGDELAQAMRSSWRQPISVLARWIVARKVLCFKWRGQLLLPLFQFEAPRMTPHEGVVAVVTELGDVMDDPALAGWFLRPNAWMHGATPADAVVEDPAAVFVAARSDRLATGLGRHGG